MLLVALAVLRPSPAQVMYEQAEARWKSDPADFARAEADFQRVAEQFPGTKWAAKAGQALAQVEEKKGQAAKGAFDLASSAAQAAEQEHDYARALKAWENFPAALATGEIGEKVRAAKLKALLPVRVDGLMRAFQNKDKLEDALQYIDPEELAASGRDLTLGTLKLLRGGAAIFVELEGWEIKNFGYSADGKSCKVTAVWKLFNKFNKKRETKDDPQLWIVYKENWYRRFKGAEGK
jgi:hypothetical protein